MEKKTVKKETKKQVNQTIKSNSFGHNKTEEDKKTFEYLEIDPIQAKEIKMATKYQRQLENLEAKFVDKIKDIQRETEIKFEKKLEDTWNKFIRS